MPTPELPRQVKRAGYGWFITAAFLVSAFAAYAVPVLYDRVFPFRGAGPGRCLVCGAQTALEPGGWKSFCESHWGWPLFARGGLFFAEALSLLIVAVSLWCLLRRVAYRGKGASWVVVIGWIVVSGISVFGGWVVPAAGWEMTTLFALMVFGLSAVFVDALDSFIVATTLVFGVAALITLLIKLVSWVIGGYWGLL